MPFSSIRGHESIISGLRAAWQNDRVSHAYLFSGPDGIGKRLVANAFLQLINCAAPTEQLDGCGVCRTCRLFADGRHPDMLQVEPDGQFIKIAQVRETTRMLRFPPVEAPTRSILIHEAERMHEAAANAILKTLEEPSARNIFILLSSRPNALLPTILSRCQQVRFSMLPRELVSDWLQAEHELDSNRADEVAAMSGGSLGHAAQLIDPTLTELRDGWLETLASITRLTPTQLLGAAEELGASKDAMPPILDAMRIGLRDALLRSSGVSASELTFRHRDVLPDVSAAAALSALATLDEAEEALQGNVNPRMVSEHLLLGIRRALI